MRENRTYGSEGGKRHLFPTPISRGAQFGNGSYTSCRSSQFTHCRLPAALVMVRRISG